MYAKNSDFEINDIHIYMPKGKKKLIDLTSKYKQVKKFGDYFSFCALLNFPSFL